MARIGSSELQIGTSIRTSTARCGSPKWVKMGAVSVRGDPTQALNRDRDRMWADEVSSARIVIL